MCGDEHLRADGTHEHEHEHQQQVGDGQGREQWLPSRRSVLQGVVGLAALGLAPDLVPRPRAGTLSVDGLTARSMAMHIHSSFSEQTGSMDAHLSQATKNAVDVIWWTDHDYRMLGVKYRTVVHFTSLTGEATDGSPWQWVRESSGPLTGSSTAGIVTSPASPHDPVAGGSLSLAVRSSTTSAAAIRFFAQSHSAGWNYQTNLYGQVLTIDVHPVQVGPGGYLELRLTTSYHPAAGGRPAGVYTLSYRFTGTTAPRTRRAEGVQGIVTVPAATGAWTTVQLTPSDDIAAIWPDMATIDFASSELRLGAVSTGGQTSGHFDYLRFHRPNATGDVPLQLQESIEPRYAAAYPGVTQRQGLEVSQFLPHLNWFGGGVRLPDYGGGVPPRLWSQFCLQQVAAAHDGGGLVSYNHPFGYSSGPALPTTQQDSRLADLVGVLLGNHALDCDLLEVGYNLRSGVDLAHHLGLWDVLSRNARFLTGNGVTDDHAGTNWLGIKNNWVTSTWVASTSEANLLGALLAGRVWAGSLSQFRGTLDLLVDGAAPMGSVTVSRTVHRVVRVMATGLPSGSSVQVVRGVVDYAGTAARKPNTKVVATYSAAQLAGGAVSYTEDNTSSAFLRTQVRTSSGRVVATSNPVWLLRDPPPGGIPAARAA